MSRRLALAALVTLFTSSAAMAEEIELFNGKDLSGWTYFLQDDKVKMEDVWTVTDGAIICKGKPNGYIKTEKDYENYVLTFEWRWKPGSKGSNSGVFVHVVGKDQIWPKGVEAQLMAGHAGDFWLVGDAKLDVDPERQDKRTPRHFLRMKDGIEKPIGEWNRYEITCKGDTIKLVINGELVNEGKNSELTKGRIILQSEGGEIHFRNIKLRTL